MSMAHGWCWSLASGGSRNHFGRQETLTGLSILLGCSLWAAPVSAQNKTCVPLGIGVPPHSRPPNWWDNTAPEFRKRLDDRTWQGATSHSDGTAESGHVDFRALRRPDSLFLSWVVKVDPSLEAEPVGDEAGDLLWFGIEQSPGKPPIVFRLSLATEQTQEAPSPPDPPAYAVRAWEVNASIQPMELTTLLFSSGGLTLPPAWFTKAARIWIKSPSGEDWAFQLVIPTNGTDPATNGLSVPTDFKMWYQLTVAMDDVPKPTVYYKWPRSPAPSAMNYDGTNGPRLTDWGLFTLASSPPQTTCIGEVTIASHPDIGTTDPTSPNELNAPKPPLPLSGNPVALAPKNTFFVRPTNRTTSSLPKGDIIANFWIANWGSQSTDWEAGVPPSNLWRMVPPPPQPPPPAPPEPSEILPVGLAPPANQIELEWTMTPCQWFNFLSRATYTDAMLINWLDSNGLTGMCPRQNANTELAERYQAFIHQCVLVELVSPPGSPARTFLRKSYWNNLHVVSASTFRRSAAISVQGVPKSEGTGPKTVYLYVQTFNMPPRVSHSDSVAVRPPVTDSAPVVRSRRDSIPDSVDPVFGERRLDLAGPTYWVHVYRVTNDSITINGAKAPVLRPQSSFGYHVVHEGDLDGWRHSLHPEGGAQMVQVAPNFYKLTVPNDSFAIVTTTIEALKPPAFALSLHAGVSLPHSSFSNTHEPGFGFTVDAEYWWNRKFAVAALLGYHRFGGEAANPDLELFHASAALEARVTSGSPSVLVDAGAGLYNFSPGSTDAGVHAGAGIEVDVTPTIALGVTARAHTVFTSGSNTTFSSLQAGGRIRF